MKKIISLFLIAVMIFSLAACGDTTENSPGVSADPLETADTGSVILETGEEDSMAAEATDSAPRQIAVQSGENTIVYELGQDVSGGELVSQLSGTIIIDVVSE